MGDTELPAITIGSSLLVHGLKSERLYFSLGAQVNSGPGWTAYHMLGLPYPERWLSALERSFLARGALRLRLYAHAPTSQLEEVLSRRGYTQRCEIVHGKTRPLGEAPPRIGTWRAVSGREWSVKGRVHERSKRASDGYDVVASQWVEMERRKSEAGNLAFYLFYVNNEPVATSGVLPMSQRVVRLKNMMVRFDRQRQGLGKAALQHLFDDVLPGDCEGAVTLSVEGSPAYDLYQSVGLREVGRTFEWTRTIAREPET
jgi:GNAT superfamily N-acetyltransferase